MLKPSPLSTAIVLSPGVWQYVMEADGGSPLSGLSSRRLSRLLSNTLSLASTGLHGAAVELELDADLSMSSLQQVQVNKMNPAGEPAFLLIHLPSETTAGH
ncbi:hypothetical protein [Pseudomonas eucalypticola]|uniref:Uncharacterized protein n=1 Tax=Pseudomonas eucalypticola TaxID=2599595 RepID=A0A7D5D6H5_9PSED|nr:hypothetical protein [Pseudomonas eucalypticola]QKZ04160.1 hypothetical protein HWQ56_10340 [Pseudomonas eucalypticola]